MEKDKKVALCFVNLEKAYGRVPSQEWQSMDKKTVTACTWKDCIEFLQVQCYYRVCPENPSAHGVCVIG